LLKEPKKLLSSDFGYNQCIRTDQVQDGSDGEPIHSPRSSSSTDGSSLPSPSGLTPIMAPKMRFKHEAYKSMCLGEDPEKRTSPFRPWDVDDCPKGSASIVDGFPTTCNSAYPSLASQNQPQQLKEKYQSFRESDALASLSRVLSLTSTPILSNEPEQDEPLALVMPKTANRGSSTSPNCQDSCLKSNGRQRNYKNMTRERRIEANARERMRVHTITAAFERLQSVIPTTEEFTKSPSQKLSKLVVIKIATSYISLLSSLAESDQVEGESADNNIQSCVRECLELIRSETKSRRKSD